MNMRRKILYKNFFQIYVGAKSKYNFPTQMSLRKLQYLIMPEIQ
jgi:hypothetical protein